VVILDVSSRGRRRSTEQTANPKTDGRPAMPAPNPRQLSMIRFLVWSSAESRSILAQLLDDLYGPNVLCRSN